MQRPDSTHQMPRLWTFRLLGLCWLAAQGGLPSAPGAPNEISFAQAIERFDAAIRQEVDSGHISGASVALVHDQETVFAKGYGWADKSRSRPASTQTVYRAGSISKLFTAMAAMKLREQGKLDIDAPARRYVPAFDVANPFPGTGEITLRQLMCHRSGMVRESPVGSYFDPSEPSVAETVASLSGCALVYPPNTQTKYSNSGITVVGQAVALVSGKAYEDYLQETFLDPMGMTSSAFLLNGNLKPHLAKGYLPVAQVDGGFVERESPHFELGTIPAGNLYTTAVDLGRFLSFLFAEGRTDSGPLLQPATLEEMFTPQLTDSETGFGLNFSIGNYRGHKTVTHSGAVYGFTSVITGIPSAKLGVVVLINDDIAIGPMRHLNQVGLDALLNAKLGLDWPESQPTHSPKPQDLLALVGSYESESFWGEITLQDNRVQADIGGQLLDLRPVKELEYEANGRIGRGLTFRFHRDDSESIVSFDAFGRTFHRVDPDAVSAPPDHWQSLLGSYGPKFIPLIVSIKHGHLYAMTENEFDNRLTPVTRYVFKMPRGLYTDEYLVFVPDRRGRVRQVILANMPLERN